MNSSSDETIRAPDPRELFDRGLELFARGRAEESVAVLRRAFFGNLFIAPALLGIPLEETAMWFPGESAGPEAAREYARERRRKWQSVPHALRYLRCLWADPLIRREIRSYTNFCKSFSRTDRVSPRLAAELLAEREKFTNERRIRSTQKEILKRIRAFRFDLPPGAPVLTEVALRVRKPEAAAEFLKNALGIPSVRHRSSGTWTFTLGSVMVRLAEGRGGPVEFTLRTDDFDYYLRRVEDEGIEPVEMETAAPRGRFLLLRAPGGLLLRLKAGEEEA